jgi:hypothetical protein
MLYSVRVVIVLSAQSVRRLSAWIYLGKEDLASCRSLVLCRVRVIEAPCCNCLTKII